MKFRFLGKLFKNDGDAFHLKSGTAMVLFKDKFQSTKICQYLIFCYFEL